MTTLALTVCAFACGFAAASGQWIVTGLFAIATGLLSANALREAR